ncbi:hypothetical protein EDB81DRAFT_426580 [Dactylonectria macrodidyma]|uniref:Uncharacterized protein n=1 Tax=Dactylonectria macrodidyma TaxID=307937 RepID=A0A9P9CZ81_9HYPO|nr:hypothetical protein EDB81DRAFT_426580 [Dactylonectria macrodidyma]
MLGEKYHAPCRIVSFTGSLLWALTYARFQLIKKRATCVELYLVDTLKLPRDVWIFPAAILARILDIKPKGVPWHDDPYHHYLLFGCLPRDDNAVVGRILFKGIPSEFNALVPGFDYPDSHERLNASLDRMILMGFSWSAGTQITANDISIARRAADELILPIKDKDVHFQIAMMFLSLRKRKWDQSGFQKLRDAFEGVRIPSTYLFTSRDSIIHDKLVDVEEWVRGMEYMRCECIMTATLSSLRHTTRVPVN